MPDSPRYSLSKTDIYKILRGALIVAAGSFSLEFLTQLQNVLYGQLDLGSFEIVRPLLTSVFASLIEATRRYFAGR